jgi:hypothetical protein
MILLGWQPKKRNVTYAPKQDFVPDWVYIEAQTAKKYYNEDWEFWVWQTAQDHNCSQALAEDACIRGIRKEILQLRFVYGDLIGKWFSEYLDMDDIFNKVKHPEYLKQLG